jgi:hypothetical protein
MTRRQRHITLNIVPLQYNVFFSEINVGLCPCGKFQEPGDEKCYTVTTRFLSNQGHQGGQKMVGLVQLG